MSHRILEHTADLGIEADGPTADEVLAEAALALTAILTGKPAHAARPDREVKFTVEAPDREALAVAFLSELLWHHSSQDLLWVGGGVRVTEAPDGSMRAEAAGNALVHDPARHGHGVEVKAVTYHSLEFARHGASWRLRVILDI